MNTIHCGVVHGEVIRKMQEIKNAISALSALDDSHCFAVSILESKFDDMWELHVANAVREYPVEAYKAFFGSEIGTGKEDA